MKNLFSRLNRSRGASIIEVVVGLFLLVPLFLCIIDLSAIVLGQITNDALAKRVARAAAQQQDAASAAAAANTIISAFQVNGIVSNPQLVNFSFNNANNGTVIVQTRLTITIPAPVPFVSVLQQSRDMDAKATEPIVMLPANP